MVFMKIVEITEDVFFMMLEGHDVGSNKSKDIGDTKYDGSTGDVYDDCRMCKGTGVNPFKKGGVLRNDGTHGNKDAKMGGPCLTCNGKGKVYLYNKHEIDQLKSARSMEELNNVSSEMYNYLINRAKTSSSTKELITKLESGVPLPEKMIDAIMSLIKNPKPKDEVKGVIKHDNRWKKDSSPMRR